MPTEPPSTRWSFPDAGDVDDDMIAIGADLEAGTILSAYRRGLFPMPVVPGGEIAWWSPVWRGVLPLTGLKITRSMRQSAKRFTTTVDRAFDEVVAGCADPIRPGGWIDEQVRAAYRVLHELGWAHSVEVWRHDELVGGLYGVAIAGLFAGESMFHRERDASKVALVALVELLRDGHDDRLLDLQWSTPHLQSLGAVEVSRRDYLLMLDRALRLPLPQPWL
jgi:leucyl/phenylalanyl-tRNA---protein transferase